MPTTTVPREFTSSDVSNPDSAYPHIFTRSFREELRYNPPQWMQAGLQETATGYGKRLNSGYMIRFNGKEYRVYVTCFSNAGSAWFKSKGRTYWVS